MAELDKRHGSYRSSCRPSVTHGSRLLALVWFVVGIGCQRSELDAGRAAELVAPHREHFGTFELWARRVLSAETELRSPASLEETIFAPVRRAPQLCGVWVVQGGPTARVLAAGSPRAAPEPRRWVRVRDSVHGTVQVAFLPEGGGAQAPCVLVRRSKPDPRGIPVSILVGYRLDGA